MYKDFRQRLRRGERMVGTLVTLPSPDLVEIMVEAGFDWLFIDTEHGAFEAAQAQVLLQAAGERCPCIVRVPSSEDVWIKKALDIGAAGIIVPAVNSLEQAQQVVSACRYPPQGTRGVGIGRAHGFGARFKEYVEHANDEVAVIIQAEHIDAVESIDAIVAVQGVDAVLVGPYDLSASMGLIGQVADPKVQAAIGRVTEACRREGVPLGIFGVNAAAVRPYMDEGYSLIAVGTDSLFAGKAARETLAALREGEAEGPTA